MIEYKILSGDTVSESGVDESMIEKLGKKSKLAIAMFVDASTAAAMLWLSYWFLAHIPRDSTDAAQKMWWLLPASSVITIALFYFFGLYRTVLRFAGAKFFVQVIVSSIVTSGLVATIALASVYGEKVGFPRRIFVLFALTLSVGATCSRLFARRYFDRRSSKNKTRAVIYGAGAGGSELYSALRYGGKYDPVAFVDDDVSLHGRSIHGLRVCSIEKLSSLIKSKRVHTVLLAMPALSQSDKANIIAKLQKFNVAIKTTPSLSELISGKANLEDLHNLQIEDLMSRPTVEPNETMAEHCVLGKSVLVTGAGGSIGSELCRQIIVRNPEKIVLYEMTESALFYIEQELLERLKKMSIDTTIVPVLGSVLDATRLKEIMLQHNVASTFHAAAYKHVPMLESNPIEGVRNNVIGTKCVVDACLWANMELLVVVSTDKAVRPTNLMGATKRFAELVVRSTAKDSSSMKTCMVRFGNVLGSSGSVVPTFRNQIRSGGPVTVTHQDMTRYFMTIPEASQLILQAGAMACDTEVFVLDMGEPVRIYDLAKRMIELSGFQVLDENHPNGDVEITFTGMRPGEKMYEELSVDDKLEITDHPKISKSIESHDDEVVVSMMARLVTAIESGDDDEVLRIVCQAVPEYTPSTQLQSNHPALTVLHHEQDSAEVEQ